MSDRRKAFHLGHCTVRVSSPCDLRNVDGQRTHPVDVGDDLDGAEDVSKIARDGLLERQQPNLRSGRPSDGAATEALLRFAVAREMSASG